MSFDSPILNRSATGLLIGFGVDIWLLGMLWMCHLWEVAHHAPSSAFVQVSLQCFGHYVRNHFLCWTHMYHDVSFGDMISNVMISNIDELHLGYNQVRPNSYAS